MTMRSMISKVVYSDNKTLTSIRKLLVRIPFIDRITSDIAFKKNMSDKEYISMLYHEYFGVYPDLNNPRNFNEKNNWRKLYDRKPLYTLMVDKYRIKDIIKERAGEEHTFPLLKVWDRAEDIDISTLPEKFVLKANHAGGVIICRDKSTFDLKKAIRELKRDLKVDYYSHSREWPYKNVERKVIAEKYMGENLVDFKNYCFNGKVYYTLVWSNHSRSDGHKPDGYFCGAYDREWKKTSMELDYYTEDTIYPKPSCYEEMVEVAEKMSAGIPFVRVDCYIIDNHVYVGEMTFFPWGGFQKFKDEKWNNYLGELEVLPEKTV